MLPNGNVIASDKRARRGPGVTPGGSALPRRAKGLLGACPHARGAAGRALNMPTGSATGPQHISGTFLESECQLSCGMGTLK